MYPDVTVSHFADFSHEISHYAMWHKCQIDDIYNNVLYFSFPFVKFGRKVKCLVLDLYVISVIRFIACWVIFGSCLDILISDTGQSKNLTQTKMLVRGMLVTRLPHVCASLLQSKHDCISKCLWLRMRA